MPDSVVPSGLYPQPPAGGGAMALGNPVDLISKIQGLKTQQLEQQKLQLGIGAAQRDLAIKSLAGLSSDFSDEELNQAVTSGRLVPGMSTEQLMNMADYLRSQKTPEARARAVFNLRNQAIDPAQLSKGVEVIDPATLRKKMVPFGEQWLQGGGSGGAAAAGGDAGPAAGSGSPGGAPYRAGRFSGYSPGEQKAYEESAGRATDVQGSTQALSTERQQLEQLKELGRQVDLAGPGAKIQKELRQAFSQFGVTPDPRLTAAEEYDKLAAQLAGTQQTTMAKTNMGLATTQAALPSLNLSKAGKEAVADMLLGRNDYQTAVRNTWMASPEFKSGQMHRFDTWMNNNAGTLDPRLFMFNRLSPEARTEFYKAIPDRDVAAFKHNYEYGMKNHGLGSPYGD